MSNEAGTRGRLVPIARPTHDPTDVRNDDGSKPVARILIARAIDDAAFALLEARGDVEYEVLENPSVAELEARIAELDAVLLGLTNSWT